MNTPPLPSLTSTWHNGPYAAISPLRPELSAAGKTIVITGAGSGIGRAAAQSFAKAGTHKIILIGRNEPSLRETQDTLECSSSIHAADVTDEKALAAVAATTGTWDVMVLAAGHISPPASIQNSSVDDWWQNFEVCRYPLAQPATTRAGETRRVIPISADYVLRQTNVKGTMIATKVFLPTANPSRAAVVAFTAVVVFPAAQLVNLSGYITSKLAVIKLMEFLAAENPNVFAAALHPGMIETKIFRGSGADPSKLPMDSVDLPANFLVWLTSPEATFLNGRSVWANWDVDELKAKAEEIQSGLLLTSGVYGWPFTSS